MHSCTVSFHSYNLFVKQESDFNTPFIKLYKKMFDKGESSGLPVKFNLKRKSNKAQMGNNEICDPFSGGFSKNARLASGSFGDRCGLFRDPSNLSFFIFVLVLEKQAVRNLLLKLFLRMTFLARERF